MGSAQGEVETLQAARVATAAHRWAEAFDLLERADGRGLLEPEDLDAFGEAAWWLGQLGTAIEVRERAYAAHLKAGEKGRAASAALALANDYGHRLQSSMASGWVSRAERLLAGIPESPAHGYLARARLNRAVGSGDLDEALRWAQRVFDIGERLGDRNLEALGLQDKGRVLVERGEVAEGLALLDEAVVAAVGGELAPYPTAVVYCNATVACQDLADYQRASQFSEAAGRWCDRQAISGFPGMCRVRRAEVTRLRGAWGDAEAEARQACVELADFCLDYAGEGFYQIGEIRLRMGDLEAAEESFRQAHELGRAPVPGLALLRLAQGKPKAGMALLRGALEDASRTRLGRARVLPALAELALAQGDLETAEGATAEMEQIADDFGTHALRAAAAAARGELLMRRGNHAGAIAILERARRLWQETEAPYETARVRILLAEAHRATGDRDAAALELQAAVATFERLGGQPDAARAGSALASMAAQEAAPETAVRTMMFTDIVRSTDLIEAVGDEAWTRVRAWHDRTVRSLIAASGGEEIDHAGDGFFVAFPSADAALACAREIQRTLADHRRDHGFAPSVRIGMHSGSAMRSGAGYEGKSVHVAARIAALAAGDEILASEETLAAATDREPEAVMREIKLRGIREPVRVGSIPAG
ncbi:MAG: tetratricopeptide repeat protein [Chloroflexi bacterium]|nr:tetratricopeptide repeat protein [Chloroflexota bacterium]